VIHYHRSPAQPCMSLFFHFFLPSLCHCHFLSLSTTKARTLGHSQYISSDCVDGALLISPLLCSTNIMTLLAATQSPCLISCLTILCKQSFPTRRLGTEQRCDVALLSCLSSGWLLHLFFLISITLPAILVSHLPASRALLTLQYLAGKKKAGRC